MKKVFLLLTLIAATISAWGATTVTKTVSQLKSSSTLVTGSNTYFALDNVISVGSVSGSARLDNNTSYLRYFQWTDKGYGSMIFKAKAGYVITSIKLKYTQAKARTVPCLFWYNENSKVRVCDTLGNNVSRSFYSNQVVIYIGNTNTLNNGEIQVTEFAVTYEQATLDRMYTKSPMDLGMQANWSHGTHPKDITLNNLLSLHSDPNTLKYYSIDNNGNIDRCFACYQANGKFWFNAHNGAKIKNIRVYYFTQSNQGVLCLSENFGKDGQSIPSNKQIASGQTVAVNGTSVSFNCGSKTTSKSGQIRVTGFQIEYTDDNSQMETYTNLNSVKSSSEVKYTGDNGIYNWKVKNFAHRDTSAMYDYLGIHLFYNGYIASDGAIEGGIKNVSFEWRLAGSTRPISEPTKFIVKAGSKTETCTQTETVRMAGHYMTYNHAFEEKSNCDFSISVGAKESTAQAQPIFGPVTITPYLLYTKKAVTIKAKDYASQNFKYTNSALINNTAGEGTISYAVSGENANKIASINSSTGEVTIKGEGTVTVTASWEGVTTTYSLTIQLEKPSIGFAEPLVTKTLSAGAEGSYQQTLTFNTPSTGTGSYYKVSGPASCTVDSDGTVHYTEAGDYVIRGVFNTLPYKPDSAQYTLRVTNLEVPTLKFDTSYVEKPVGADPFINAFSKPDDDTGAVTYSSSVPDVATVEENGDGTVTIVGAGTTTITASVAETSKYAADSKSYTLKVFPLSDISFADEEKDVYLNADPFTYAVTKTAGDGEITYSSSAESIATVDNNGLVTLTHTASGSVTITAIIAKTDNYWADTATYTLNVSSLKLPTASFGTETVVNKVQNFESFTKTADTESDGTKHYYSSDKRVATVDETTGAVTKGEKPGTTIISVSLDASATWEALNNAAQYTLNVSSAPIEDMKNVSSTINDLKTKLGWQDAPAAGKEYTNFDLDDVLTMSYGKHLYESLDGSATKTNFLRYYQKYAPDHFTIQAKAGVIIQSVKFTYVSQNHGTLAKKKGTNIGVADQYVSGTTYPVDANSFTCYFGNTSTETDGRANLTGYEIKYFDPSTGVAVTKSAGDLGWNLKLKNSQCYDTIAINQAITIYSDLAYKGQTLRYSSVYNQFNCYRWCGPITIKAREGATIHHVKITYTTTDNAVLSKYATGFNIPAIDQIASDSIIYVNANSLKLYIGSSANTGGTLSLKKIYVNYTDGEEVVVDNFDNCTDKSGDSVVVAGVDNKYTWTLKKFARDNAQRMYYDQSIKLSAGGAIYTPISGALSEVAFDWHPTEANKQVKFYVKAGNETITVDSTMNGTYTINFKKADIQDNDTFAISVDGQSATTLEIGHVSITPYILYTCKDTTIAAKDYKDASWKFTNNTLINNTDEEIEYSTSDASIASIDAAGEVTIQTGGTVIISATTKTTGVTASYQLKINLEQTSVKFNDTKVEKILSGVKGTHTQELTLVTAPESGNTIEYSITGNPADGASIKQNGEVTFTKTGVYYITGKLVQKLPYAAAEATYELTVSSKKVPHIYFATDTLNREITDGKFLSPSLWTPDEGVGVGDTTYVSKNPEVVSVDIKTGEVTPLAVGTATIKAYVEEGTEYAADSAAYVVIVYQLPKPQMHFAKDTINAYRNTPNFVNDLIVEQGDGAITYESGDINVADIANTQTGEVHITGPGTTIIMAISERTPNYQADTISYTIRVENKHLVRPTFGETSVTKYLSEKTYKNTLSLNPTKYDGTITYSSSNISVATVVNDGTVTFKKNGSVTITVNLAGNDTYKDTTASYELTILADPIEDIGTVTGNVPHYADSLHWVSGDAAANCYRYFFVGKASVNSVAGNAMYKKESDEKKYLRYYQNQNKGQFTLRVPEGGIIQSVKFKYSSVDGGVLTTNYGTDGKNIGSGNQILNDKTYKFDANFVNFYTGNTGAATNGEVRITDFVIKYFVPSTGVTVTKQMIDLKKQYGYKKDSSYLSVPLNNVISMEVTQDGTQKYLDDGNQFRYYQGNGPVTIQAREGSKILYLKITYTVPSTGNATSTLNKYAASTSVAATDKIPSDSILYVNDQSITLYVGTTNGAAGGQIRFSKVYVVYTDETASIETFKSAPLSGTTPVVVESADGIYEWQLTQYARDSTHRLYYVYTTMIRKGGKIETVGTEGGVKEVAFNWFASNSNAGAKFNVKVGDSVISAIDAAAAGGWYPISYAQTGIKKNGAFSIEVPSNSGSQVEIPHISLTPYLLYTTKDVNVTAGNSVKNADLINNTAGEGKITYSFNGTGTVDEEGTITPVAPGDYTVTATWGDVWTTYTLHVTGTIQLNENEDNTAMIAACEGKTINMIIGRNFKGGMYNTICLPFGVSKDNLGVAFQRDITSLAQYTQTASLDDAKKNLNVEIEEVDSIVAGQPYLLQFEGLDRKDPYFENVTIVKTTGDTIEGDNVDFIGAIGQTQVGATDKSILFVIANNKLAWNNTGQDSHMNGFRAYFKADGMNQSGVAPRLVFRQPATPTELMQNAQCTMQGVQKLIINNQLVIIREGKMYNAQGAEF